MITVYTLPSCVQCDATKRQLAKSGIEYVEVKLHEAPEALEKIKAMGFTAAPVIETPEAAWSGFRPDLIATLTQ